MDGYVTGTLIRNLRESKGLSQNELAEKLFVSAQAVSKWETGRGLPDISLLAPLGEALGVSVSELVRGEAVTNRNRAGNMLRSLFYVCPICGNVIHSLGRAAVSCCGVTLPELVPEEAAVEHLPQIEPVEDEFYVTLDHPMSKEHYISFLAAVGDNGTQLVKLYPEGEAEARFKLSRVRWLYVCCNRHGLFRLAVKRKK
ncbi:MAG: helix-turn-helix domain-containing protein [Firmicutes bacterium]|nr:helix-turn-helix domain-containing protein [Bacillota bacterium]